MADDVKVVCKAFEPVLNSRKMLALESGHAKHEIFGILSLIENR